MRRRFILLAVIAVFVCGSPASAQSPDLSSRILSAAELPISAAQARSEGTTNEVLGKVLEVLRGAKVPAGEASDVIQEEREARREHGPVDNFGAFVQSQLAAGLRGRELAAAIRAEHAANGKGPKGVARSHGGKSGAAASNGRGQGRGGRGGAGVAGAAGAPAEARARGGQPAARAAHDSSSARGAAPEGRGPAGKGKPANRPSHPNR